MRQLRYWMGEIRARRLLAKQAYAEQVSTYAWQLFGQGEHRMAAAILSALVGYSTRSLRATKRRVWASAAAAAREKGAMR